MENLTSFRNLAQMKVIGLGIVDTPRLQKLQFKLIICASKIQLPMHIPPHKGPFSSDGAQAQDA